MFYSKQKFFCNICGKEMLVCFSAPYAARFCGRACYKEFNWRTTLSIMGKEYYPDPTPDKDD